MGGCCEGRRGIEEHSNSNSPGGYCKASVGRGVGESEDAGCRIATHEIAVEAIDEV